MLTRAAVHIAQLTNQEQSLVVPTKNENVVVLDDAEMELLEAVACLSDFVDNNPEHHKEKHESDYGLKPANQWTSVELYE